MSDAWTESCAELRRLALVWLTTPDADPGRAAAAEACASAFLRWTTDHRDAIHLLAQSASPKGLVAMQRLGRIAFRVLVENQVRDPKQLARLRRVSSMLLSGFPGLRGEVERSDLYQSAIQKLLKRVETGWPDFEDENHLDRYLAKIVTNLLIDLHNLADARGPIDRGDGLTPDSERFPAQELTPDLGAIGSEHIRRRDRARTELEARLRRVQPPALRVVCGLRLRHGISVPELAQHWMDLAGSNEEPLSLDARRKRIERRCDELRAGLDDLDGGGFADA